MGEQNQRQTTKRTEGVFLYDALMNDTYVLEESQKPAFAKQYRRAATIVCDAVCRAIKDVKEQSNRRESHQRHVNNLIPIIGERGTGKTSVMRSFCCALERYNGITLAPDPVFPCYDLKLDEQARQNIANAHFLVLDVINAGELKGQDDILEITLARMQNILKQEVEYGARGTSQGSLEELRRLLQKFETLYRNLRYLNSPKRDSIPEGESALRALQNLSSSQSVIWEFEDLVESYLDYFDHKAQNEYHMPGRKSFLVIALDDVDRYTNKTDKINGKNAYTLLEEIYEHLTLPRVLVLMTLDEEMLRTSVERYIASAFGIEETQKKVQASQLLAKILPTYHRVYTPNYTYNIWTGVGNKKQQIYVRLPEAMQQELVLTEEPIPAKKLNLCLLAERAGVYFDALGEKQHFFEQRNIRELHDFLRKLDEMEQPNQPDAAENETIREENRRRLLEYLNDTFYVEKLSGAEQDDYKKRLCFSIDRRSEELLYDIRINRKKQEKKPNFEISAEGSILKFETNEEDISEGFRYSYGELIYNLYHATREGDYSKEMIHCILALYSVELNQIYGSVRATQENEADRKQAARQLQKFIGPSVTGRWINKMLPKIMFRYEDEMTGKMEHFKTRDCWAYNKASLDEMVVFRRPLLSKKEDTAYLLRVVEMMLMLFTNLPHPYKKIEKHTLQITASGKEILIKAKSSKTLCFNVLNFCVNSFRWEQYFNWVDDLFKEAIKEYFKVNSNLKAAGFTSVAQLEEELDTFSLRNQYKAWDARYGSLALPLQQFDLTYNLFKRLANDTSDMPTSIPDADMLKCCGWLYGKISHRLREESDVYGGILGDASFEKIFEGCPFVARMLALNADKDYPPLFQTIEMPEEEQKYDTDVLNGFFSKLAQSASIQAQNNNESAKNENASMLEQSDMDAEKTKKAQQTEAIIKDLNLSPNGGQQEKQ